ncbi:glutathione-dependent formaldehyde-activating GFA [Roseibium sp. TrichSKD4]|nr:glutathione-dependent formaldehyde-activating GFA [Roseibium sp. TrichSKD4]
MANGKTTMSEAKKKTGGCQCGAIRFEASDFGRSSVCHCRMCQKALGGPYAVLVTARDLKCTRGAPKHFQSSDKVKRGFCADCGTPLTYEFEGSAPDVTVASFDDPSFAPPTVQLDIEAQIPWCETVPSLPYEGGGEGPKPVSYQHPDHDTPDWPMAKVQQERAS